MNNDFKHMFDQIMLKIEGCNSGKVVVDLPKEVDKSKETSSDFEVKSLNNSVHGNH